MVKKENMNDKRIIIPYHLMYDIKSKIKEKYEKSLLKKDNIDSYIFLNKKLVTLLSKYTLLSSLNMLDDFSFNINNIDNKLTINNEIFIIYGYVEKDEFIYIEKDKNESNHVIIRFVDNLRYAHVVYNSIIENLISDFDLDLSDKQLKISINKIEELIKKHS
jgi:hypothetical protein